MSLVLVTGGTGFVGSYVIRLLLDNGYRVRATRRPGSRMDLLHDVADRVEWVEADVTDMVALEDAFEGVTHVMHCVALVSFHPRDERRMRQVNVDGTANMVNLALEKNVQQFIHVSSIAAFGRTKERPVIDENSKWVNGKANSNYAISKYLGEQEVWRAHFEGLPVAIVSPSMILGPGYWNEGTGKYFSQVYQGLKFWPVGASGFVDVRDVAQFMILLLQNNINGERYILNAENTSFRAFFNSVSAALGVKGPFIKVTPLLAEVAWRVEWLKEKLLGAEPVVTREAARASVGSYAYVNKKSLTIPGFSYRPLETTIRETAQAFLETTNNKQ